MFSKHNLAGVAVATLVAFSLTACGGDIESQAKAFVKEEYPDAKILSFSEIQKEFGLKDKECLKRKKGSASLTTRTYHFIKTADGELLALDVDTDDKNGASIMKGTFTPDEFKKKRPSCFE